MLLELLMPLFYFALFLILLVFIFGLVLILSYIYRLDGDKSYEAAIDKAAKTICMIVFFGVVPLYCIGKMIRDGVRHMVKKLKKGRSHDEDDT